MTKNWKKEILSCHEKSILVARNQFLPQQINSCHKKSFLVSSHPSVELINSQQRANPTKHFAWAYTFRGNLVPRGPVNSPPWGTTHHTTPTQNSSLSLLKTCRNVFTTSAKLAHKFYPIFSQLVHDLFKTCEIFTAAARRALVVIMSKCVSVIHVTFSRPLIGRKYHRHWGRGRWAPRRQNIVEAIHVNDNICCSRKIRKIMKVVPHSDLN